MHFIWTLYFEKISLNSFHANVSLYPLKTSENLWFAGGNVLGGTEMEHWREWINVLQLNCAKSF